MQGHAESTGLPHAGFDVVCAGQCWHWFDRTRASAEALRLLAPGGSALIAYFSYLPDPGSLAEATERLVLRHNPGWTMHGLDGRYPMLADDLTAPGFRDPATFDFVVPTPFTHESWRGRFRACHGVLALPPETLAAFDAELAELLRAFPEPLVVPHRVFGIVARR
jgi:SAM-dependent methyltransferase